jgi:hypothetical protein
LKKKTIERSQTTRELARDAEKVVWSWIKTKMIVSQGLNEKNASRRRELLTGSNAADGLMVPGNLLPGLSVTRVVFRS